MANMHGSFPRIDFTGIDPAASSAPGDSRWAAARAAVMDALCEHGGFEAVMDDLIAPELRAAMLGPGGAMDSLFALPPSAKARYHNKEKPYLGYVGSPNPGMPFESFSIMNPLTPDDAVPAGLMEPDTTGDASFCETVRAYTEKVAALEAVMRRMVLESVGATAEFIEEQAKATSLRLRLSRYPAPGTAAGRLGLAAHRDTSILSVLMQNGIDGLEVKHGGSAGGWACHALSSPGSFLVVAGDMLKVLTNGQVLSPLHRVVLAGDKTRYTAILFSNPKDDAVVRAVDGAVDAGHPAVYRPFKYSEYVNFCYKAENYKLPNKLEPFAAVGVGLDG